MAILMVTFGIERMLALRRRKVLPPELVQELGELAARKGGLDPRKAYRVCQQHPSAAASVIRATLLKVGRPHSEVEHAVVDASEREAARLYKNVRPINLATAVSPLLGLLGTVQGMIEAFALTAAGIAGVNKAEQLAGGIYVALVTTFAGLCVAIPGAMLSHYFEGRIQSLFRDIDELLLGLLPQLERFEGKLRMSRSAVEESPREPGSHRESDVGEKPPLPVASQS
jgi:biopolymer transport protein ExbB